MITSLMKCGKLHQITAKTKGYRYFRSCRDALIKLFDKRQIKGQNDSGNGRLVRNID